MNNIEKTKSFWSNGFIAKLYRRSAGKRFFKMHQKIAQHILSRNPKDVLDIACGPGDFLFYLSNLNPNVSLTGTDIAPGMVKHASQKLSGKARILEADARNQPFPENSFDAITIMMSFHHFLEKPEALQKIKKLLRQNGILIIADAIAKSNFQKKFWDFLEKVTSVRGYVGHYTENDIKESAKKAGFYFSAEYVPEMPKRYKICKLTK